jgi:hypothetical protein
MRKSGLRENDVTAHGQVGFMSAIEGQYQAAVDGLSAAIEQRLQQDEADIQQVRCGVRATATNRRKAGLDAAPSTHAAGAAV